MTTRSLATLTTALLTATLLTGCSDNEPAPQRTEPSAPTPGNPGRPSSPPPPGSPDQPRKTEAQVVISFFQEFSASISTGESKNFMAFTTPSCRDCATLRTNLENAYADGGYVKGGRWELVSANPRDGDVSTWYVRVSTAQERWFNGDRERVKTIRKGLLDFVVYLTPRRMGPAIRMIRLR